MLGLISGPFKFVSDKGYNELADWAGTDSISMILRALPEYKPSRLVSRPPK